MEQEDGKYFNPFCAPRSEDKKIIVMNSLKFLLEEFRKMQGLTKNELFSGIVVWIQLELIENAVRDEEVRSFLEEMYKEYRRVLLES